MKTSKLFTLVAVFLALLSCEKEKSADQKQPKPDKTSEYVNEYPYQKEMKVLDQSGNNSILVRIKSKDENNLNHFLKHKQVKLIVNTGDVNVIKSKEKKSNNKSAGQNKTDTLPNKINEDAIPVWVEVIAENFTKEVNDYSLEICNINTKSTEDWVMGYPTGYSVKSKDSDFLGIVHYGWSGSYKIYCKFTYNECGPTIHTIFGTICPAKDAFTAWLYPNGTYWACMGEDWDVYKRNVLVYECRYQDPTPSYRVAKKRNDFRGHNCTIGHYDGANCHVGTPPSGTNAFIWHDRFYYTPVNGNQCPMEGSWFDGANCYVMEIPDECAPFIYNNKFYVSPDIIQ